MLPYQRLSIGQGIGDDSFDFCIVGLFTFTFLRKPQSLVGPLAFLFPQLQYPQSSTSAAQPEIEQFLKMMNNGTSSIDVKPNHFLWLCGPTNTPYVSLGQFLPYHTILTIPYNTTPHYTNLS